jgi:hypothetical protein
VVSTQSTTRYYEQVFFFFFFFGGSTGIVIATSDREWHGSQVVLGIIEFLSYVLLVWDFLTFIPL